MIQKKFLPLFLTQFFGVFNDNLLKSLLCFLGVTWVAADQESMVLTLSASLLIIPYLLFSPLAGHLTKLYPRKRIVTFAKFCEIPIMAMGLTAFCIHSLPLGLSAVFLMGVQSAIYSPAKYGLIREIGGDKHLSFGTGTMEMLSFIGILIGMVWAGFLSEFSKTQVLFMALSFFCLSVAGWFSSMKIPQASWERAVEKGRKYLNPLTFIKHGFLEARKIKGMNATILGLAAFWVIGSLIQLNVLIHCPAVYGMDNSETALAGAFLAIGIGLGCFVAGWCTKGRVEPGMSVVGGVCMLGSLSVIAFADLSSFGFIFWLALSAFFSGFYKVPLNAWLQQRASNKSIGTLLAYSNMVVFLGIIVSAVVFELVVTSFGTQAVFIVIVAVVAITLVILLYKIPGQFVRFIFWMIGKLIYRTGVHGLENLPVNSGGLVVANHVGYMDSFLIIAAMPRMARFVMMKKTYQNPWMKWFYKSLNMIPIGSRNEKNHLAEFNKRCQEEINKGHLVCIFAEGQVSRNGHLLEFKKGIEHIANGLTTPVFPVHIDGALGSPFTYDNVKKRMIGMFQGWGKKVNIAIGEPSYYPIKAETIRSQVKELEVENFGRRISQKETLISSLKSAFMKNEEKPLVLTNGGQILSYGDVWNKALRLTNNLPWSEGNVVGVGVMNFSDRVVLNLAFLMKGIVVSDGVDKAVVLDGVIREGSHNGAVNINEMMRDLPLGKSQLRTDINRSASVMGFKNKHYTHEAFLNAINSLKQIYNWKSLEYCVSNDFNSPNAYLFNFLWPILSQRGFLNNGEKQPFELGFFVEGVVGPVAMQTPGFEGVGLDGKKIFQKGCLEGTYGKVMPGVQLICGLSGLTVKTPTDNIRLQDESISFCEIDGFLSAQRSGEAAGNF